MFKNKLYSYLVMKIIRKKDTPEISRGGYRARELGAIHFHRPMNDAIIFVTTIPKNAHFQEQWHNESGEFMYFLSAAAVLIDGKKHIFEEGDALYLEPHEKHKILAEEQDIVVLAIRFPNLPEDKHI